MQTASEFSAVSAALLTVDCRGAGSPGGVGSAGYRHGTAAAVAPDRCGGFTVCLNGEVGGSECAAACHMDTAGGILFCGDRGVGYGDIAVAVAPPFASVVMVPPVSVRLPLVASAAAPVP